MLEEDREGTDAMGQESMLAAPTEKEDQVAVAAKETVDKATEKTAEAGLEEQQGDMGEVPVLEKIEENGGAREASFFRGHMKNWSKGAGEAGDVWSRGSSDEQAPGIPSPEERNPCVSSEAETLWEAELDTQREEG